MQRWKYIDQFEVSKHAPDEEFNSHAQLPTPLKLSQNSARIFFASRNSQQISSIYSIDLVFSLTSESIEWMNFSRKPLLSPGEIGSFDEHGVYPSSIMEIEDCLYLFYIGWNRGEQAPLFYSSVGLAKSLDGENFTKVHVGPILARSRFEPYLVTSPFVEKIEEDFQMHYVSGIEWKKTDDKIESRYDIKRIKSNNINEWSSENRLEAIPLRQGETNIARPWIFTNSGIRYLYFCFLQANQTGYQIGVARERLEGGWQRLDNEIEITGVSENLIWAYPAVIELEGKKILFLNGEGYGKRGFYIFKLED